jgi:hypothetical protein
VRGLPLRYLLTAAGAFLLAAAAAPFLAEDLAAFHYRPLLVALTHTVTLGWITLALMGASLALHPIRSERLAAWQYWTLLAGIVGMVAHFAIGRWNGLAWASGLVGVGIVLHVLNMVRSPRPAGPTGRLVLLGLAGLLATLAFGFLLALDRNRPFLPGPFFGTLFAHFHLALLAWVGAAVLGVMARVLPLLLRAPEPRPASLSIQFWGLGLGTAAVVAALLTESRWLPLPALAVAAAVTAFVLETARIARRRRAELDWGLGFVLTGTGLLVPATGLGLGLAAGLFADPRLAGAYAALALGGWASLTIAGLLLGIARLLVMGRADGSRAGRSWPAAEGVSWALLTLGIAGLAFGMAVGSAAIVRPAGIALAAGAVALSAALGWIAGLSFRQGLAVAAFEASGSARRSRPGRGEYPGRSGARGSGGPGRPDHQHARPAPRDDGERAVPQPDAPERQTALLRDEPDAPLAPAAGHVLLRQEAVAADSA